jgi:hypothetical protein
VVSYPKISTQSASEVGKIVSPKQRPPLSPGNVSGTHLCQRLGRPQGHSVAGSSTSMKNYNDKIPYHLKRRVLIQNNGHSIKIMYASRCNVQVDNND